MTVSLAQMSTHRGHTFFEVFHRPVSGFYLIAGSSPIFCSKKTNSLGGLWFENPSNYRTQKAVFFVVFTTFMIEVFITLKEKNDTISWAKSRLWARSRATGLSFVRFWFLIIYMKKFIEYDWKRAVQFLVHSSKTRKYNGKKEIKGKFLR